MFQTYETGRLKMVRVEVCSCSKDFVVFVVVEYHLDVNRHKIKY